LTFDLRAILVFVIAAAVYAGLLRGARRQWAILLGSVVAIYWLQPPLPIRFSDFILPTATIALTVITWLFTRQRDSEEQAATAAQDRLTLLLITLLVVGLSFMRFVDTDFRITASRPPSPLALLVGLLLLAGVVAIAMRMWRARAGQRNRDVLTGLILLLVALFVVLKTEALASGVSRWWRAMTGQDTTLASPIDLAWLGFSFVAFRLIHTLRDRQSGILPVMSLLEYVSYVIFFPAYTAGPIDRAERFVSDFRALPAMAGLDAARLGEGAWRISLGLLKKFVIADSLAQGMALTVTNAQQTQSSLGLWVLLRHWHRYSFRYSAAGKLSPAVPAHEYHRILAKLAYHPEQLGALLCFYPLIPLAAAALLAPVVDPHRICRPNGHHDRHWPVARLYLELLDLGDVAWAGPVRPQTMERPHPQMAPWTGRLPYSKTGLVAG